MDFCFSHGDERGCGRNIGVTGWGYMVSKISFFKEFSFFRLGKQCCTNNEQYLSWRTVLMAVLTVEEFQFCKRVIIYKNNTHFET